MTGTRIVVDSLWRCLCPSVDATSLRRVVNASTGAGHPPLRRASRNAGPARGAHTVARRPRLGCTASPTRPPAAGVTSAHSRASFGLENTISHVPAGARHVHADAVARVGRLSFFSSPESRGTSIADSQQHMQLAVNNLLRARYPFQKELAAASTAAIYAALRELQDIPQAYIRTQAFGKHLLEERGEAPTAALYEALVRSNCHVNGSAEAVHDLLRVVSEGRIEGTSGVFHGALAVLAVHPDYLLRNAVLREMKDRWIELSPDGQVSVALGLLRDGQYERALNHLDSMTEAAPSEGTGQVPSWLLDIYVYVLGQEGFLDDALQIANHRLLREGDSVSLNVWSFLLDICCRRGHFGGLVYVWNRAVRPNGGNGIVTLSDAMALDVLNMAAQHGDANLAAKVMQMLSARGTKLSMAHFEAMLDCYAQAGAIDKALQALCIMNDAGIVPDQGSTRSIYLSLLNSTAGAAKQGIDTANVKAAVVAATESAVASLFDLKRQYGSVPVAAFNVVLEVMLASRQQTAADIASSTGFSRKVQTAKETNTDTDAEAALDLYRHVRQLCPAGPNRATFRLLFRACTLPMHLNFLLREMGSFGFRPDMEMIDQVVYENATQGSLDVALQHVFDLMGESEGSRRTSHVDDIKDGGGASEATNVAHAESLRRQPWIGRRASAALAKRCIDEADERIWVVADASRDRGRPMDNIIREASGGEAGRRRRRSNAYGEARSVDVTEAESPTLDEANLSG